MAVVNCRRCNRIFNAVMGYETVCPACQKKDNEDFKKVKDFLWDHPGLTIDEVSELFDVDPKTIKGWLREEKLSLADGTVADVLRCEKCGTPILSGRFCEKCKAGMINELKHSIEKPKMSGALVSKPTHDDPSKMRFLGKSKKKK